MVGGLAVNGVCDSRAGVLGNLYSVWEISNQIESD